MVSKVQPYEKLVDYIKNNPQKGLTIPHTDIEQIIGVPYRKGCGCLNGTYSYQVKKANEKLLSLCLALEPIQGFGYRILKDNQYVDVMKRNFNIGFKYIQKAKEYGDNTNIISLTKKQYAEWENAFSIITDAYNHLSTTPFTLASKKP